MSRIEHSKFTRRASKGISVATRDSPSQFRDKKVDWRPTAEYVTGNLLRIHQTQRMGASRYWKQANHHSIDRRHCCRRTVRRGLVWADPKFRTGHTRNNRYAR